MNAPHEWQPLPEGFANLLGTVDVQRDGSVVFTFLWPDGVQRAVVPPYAPGVRPFWWSDPVMRRVHRRLSELGGTPPLDFDDDE